MSRIEKQLIQNIKYANSTHGEGCIAEMGARKVLELDQIADECIEADSYDLRDALHSILDHPDIEPEDAEEFVTALVNHSEMFDWLKEDDLLKDYFVEI